MRTNIGIFLFTLCIGIGVAFAGDMREIEFTDGSVVTGEVLSLSGGKYTIKTGSLGTVTVEESKVRAIRQQGAAASSPPDMNANAEARSLQERMLRDQEIMTMIQSLQNNPDFQKALQDPEIMRAVNAGDVPALTANPEFMKLLQNSTVKDIQKKVGN